MTSSSALSDKGGAVRDGEELDLSTLNPWLKSKVEGLSGEPAVTQYAGGASNWTYCLSYPERDVVLRRAPAGTKAKGAHDMGREYRLQAALKPVYSYVPTMLAHSDDVSIVGAEFYVMEKVVGLIPRTNLPRNLSMSVEQHAALCHNALDSLIELHQVDYQSAGLDTLAKGAGYTQRQIEGWSHRYQKAKTWNVPSGQNVMRWLSDHLPADERICLTHNDFRLDNLVLDTQDPTRIIGVLDWELATLGDPLMDLGNTLAYWVEADDDFFAQKTRRQPTHLPGMLSRQQVVDYYTQKTGFSYENFSFYEVYGLFRLAGIVQQIYYRYHHKQTRNPAFKQLWVFVHYLLHRCRKIINRSGLA
ncbi:phosphotransferase family protein [Arenicella xantha]|uniref:Aminoglycoside phosphotransferase (APT) family kinase protein n=1 Tax=Arenicella xantha TaxID=644221 RepID=A0A395JGK7_9GAMM|nr:phosphotransferase family protein [Arenicella xantha]RBP49120.1 aminoglycoside phosphotransferase (APT) family kinase protein [Arenicella xantha]